MFLFRDEWDNNRMSRKLVAYCISWDVRLRVSTRIIWGIGLDFLRWKRSGRCSRAVAGSQICRRCSVNGFAGVGRASFGIRMMGLPCSTGRVDSTSHHGHAKIQSSARMVLKRNLLGQIFAHQCGQTGDMSENELGRRCRRSAVPDVQVTSWSSVEIAEKTWKSYSVKRNRSLTNVRPYTRTKLHPADPRRKSGGLHK